jgi:nucleoid DNA-binding protein
MNKTDLVEKIAASTGITKTAAAAAVDVFIDSVTMALKKGDRVTLVGFGTFPCSSVRPATGAIRRLVASSRLQPVVSPSFPPVSSSRSTSTRSNAECLLPVTESAKR